MTKPSACAVLALLMSGTSSGCSDPGDEGAVQGGDAVSPGNLGVEGASCLRSADCVSPLQCLDNVCRSTSGSGSDADAAVADSIVPETIQDTGVADYETYNDLSVPEDIPQEYDASDWEFLEDTEPDSTPADVPLGDIDIFDEGCGVLGISEHWSGPFDGLIEFHVSQNPLTPSDGYLPVEGTLSFDIECIETKFVVKGTMDGIATIEGQAGEFPFTMKIQGYYSPLNHQMQAKMVEGAVNIYGLIEVYFEGDFLGELMADGEFDGTWTGHSTGTNQTFITGTAEGSGIWGAAPL